MFDDEARSEIRWYDRQLFKRLLPFMRPHYRLFATLFLLIPLTSLVHVAQPFVVKQAIDYAIVKGIPGILESFALMYLALLISQFILERMQIYFTQLLGQKMVMDIRTALFGHLQSLSMSYYSREPAGRLITRVINDVENFNEMFTSGLISIIGDIVLLSAIATAMFLLDWRLALTAFAVLIPLFFIVRFFRRALREVYRSIRVLSARVNTYLQENILGMSVVQTFNREDKNYEIFSEYNKDYRDANLKSVFYDSWFSAVVEAGASIAIAGIIWRGGGQILTGVITFGLLVAFIEYVHKFFDPIQELTAKYAIMQNAMASCEKIFNLMDVKDTPPAYTENPITNHRFKGKIEFRDVSFSYLRDKEILHKINFGVKPGEKVAIVGHTGAGKTTMAKLLNRLYDVSEGAIFVDETDIRKFPLDELREAIGVVPQDVFMFSGSVRENILLGRNIAKEVFDRATKVSGLEKIIGKFSSGYETNVGERGVALSAGERQILAFARILAYDPPILVFDEATSNIDAETESLIQGALPALLEGRTAIIIAHRLSTVRMADRIIVLHNGTIYEEGTHEELFKKKGIYWRLYRIQMNLGKDIL